MSTRRLGGIEAGGTKFVCLVGDENGAIQAEERFDTRDPTTTIADARGFFRRQAERDGPIDALGIASFGPLELRRDDPRYGHIVTTPKAGWSNVDLLGPFAADLGVPIGFDTDVNGAALAEARWGAARGLSSFVYFTIGTGIGGGAIVNGAPVHGLVHPEMGHIAVPRMPGDTFAGSCPFHGDCFEGMASGTAMRARWGRPAQELTGEQLAQAIETEATYLAAGCRTTIYALAPQRILLGGGVAEMPGLLPKVRSHLAHQLADYPGLPEHTMEEFVVAPGLGSLAGPSGALALALDALPTA